MFFHCSSMLLQQIFILYLGGIHSLCALCWRKSFLSKGILSFLPRLLIFCVALGDERWKILSPPMIGVWIFLIVCLCDTGTMLVGIQKDKKPWGKSSTLQLRLWLKPRCYGCIVRLHWTFHCSLSTNISNESTDTIFLAYTFQRSFGNTSMAGLWVIAFHFCCFTQQNWNNQGHCCRWSGRH